MAPLSGLFRAPSPPRAKTLPGKSILAVFLLTAGSVWAAVPDYVRTALAHFNPNVPAGWAYTLETTRNDRQMTERFDPARPPGGQWTLRTFQGRSPTPEETEKYLRSRPTAGAGGTQANFQKDDIEPGSMKLVHEDETRAEYEAGFREQSAGPDKMLEHLRLRLTICKQPAYVERYVLELIEPYWPVLGVKMHELHIEGEFTAPRDQQPSLPSRVESHFTGRILLFSNEEKLRLIYSEFSAAPL